MLIYYKSLLFLIRGYHYGFNVQLVPTVSFSITFVSKLSALASATTFLNNLVFFSSYINLPSRLDRLRSLTHKLPTEPTSCSFLILPVHNNPC